MRRAGIWAAAVLSAASLLAAAGTALADGPSPSPTAGEKSPTDAGTTFRTATAIAQSQKATASASSGDYLYWVFPADAGQRATVRAEVALPDAAARHGASTWRIDVYDGLRRRQPCMYGMQSRTAAVGAASVELSCTLRTVRALAEPWANDPLPGSYYVRLTMTEAPEQDMGLPVRAEVEAVAKDMGGAYAVDGTLSEPLVPGVSAASGQAGDAEEVTDGASDEGFSWSSGWWSDRWLWTGAGAVLAALAGIGGHALTRGSGRPARVPPGA
ncbi:hypothetical protein [Streptomyces sp. NPDC018833]|uniref:hypothetical protein n=1 Tax=Streptomyces sp. NPDC018833 TaxID=3365053 RepID=UPI00379E05C4